MRDGRERDGKTSNGNYDLNDVDQKKNTSVDWKSPLEEENEELNGEAEFKEKRKAKKREEKAQNFSIDENGEIAKEIEVKRKSILDYKIPIANQILLHNPDENDTRKKPIRALAIDKTGSWVASGGSNTKISLYDFNRMNESHEPSSTMAPSEGCTVIGASFSPSADSLVVATDSVCPCILNPLDGKIKIQFIKGDIQLKDPRNTKGHIGNVTSCCWHPLDEDALITSGLDGTIRLWRPEAGKKTLRQLTCDKVYRTKNIKNTAIGVSCSIYSINGEYIIAGCIDGSIQFFDATNTNIIDPMPFAIIRPGHGDNYSISGLVVHPNGLILASRGFDHSIRLWNMRNVRSKKVGNGRGGFNKSMIGSPHIPVAIIPNITSYREQSNLVFSPCGKLVCTGTNTDDGKTRGRLLFYNIEKIVNLVETSVETKPNIHEGLNGHSNNTSKTSIDSIRPTENANDSTINSVEVTTKSNVFSSINNSNKLTGKGKVSLTHLAGSNTKSAPDRKLKGKFTALAGSSTSSSNIMSFKKKESKPLTSSSSSLHKVYRKDEKCNTSSSDRYGETKQDNADSGVLSPLILDDPLLNLPITGEGISIIHLVWHSLLNQIFISTMDGATIVCYDRDFSKYGAVISSRKKSGKRKGAGDTFVGPSHYELDQVVRKPKRPKKVGALTPEIQEVTLEQHMVQSALLQGENSIPHNPDIISAIAQQKVTRDPNRVLQKNTHEQELEERKNMEKKISDLAKRYY